MLKHNTQSLYLNLDMFRCTNTPYSGGGTHLTLKHTQAQLLKCSLKHYCLKHHRLLQYVEVRLVKVFSALKIIFH
jgi:hypothetical protein